MKKNLKNSKFIILGIVLFVCAIFFNVNAQDPSVVIVESFCDMTYRENFIDDNGRELSIYINDVAAGKRLTGIKYCLAVEDCTNENNWIDAEGNVSSFGNSVGGTDMFFTIMVPTENIKLKAVFTDFEPMNISYARYKIGTENEEEYWDVYTDKTYDLDNYEEEFTPILTGYRGGDIILPEGCTENGCLLKISMNLTDYNSMMDRLDYFNENQNEDFEYYDFLSLSSMFNHLDTVYVDSVELLYEDDEDGGILIETDEENATFYFVVNKFFDYEKNRTDVSIGDNKFRILGENYIGLNYSLDEKYFDAGKEYGFLAFNEFNDYYQDLVIFYGTPEIQFEIDSPIPVSLADGGSSNMGTLKFQYNSIKSDDQGKFPIDNNFVLSINSFYEQDYRVPLALKDANNETKHITLNLSRLAFGGNAGSLLVVDGDGINCRDVNREDVEPNCVDGNMYVSTLYYGLFDTFYSSEDLRTEVDEVFEIEKFDGQELRADRVTNVIAYERNDNFRPWATAIYYSDDVVMFTKSFNLEEAIKVTGISEEKIDNSFINNHAYDFANNLITDFDNENYNLFRYGHGLDLPISKIKYFDQNTYNDKISYRLLLASQEEITENNIDKIALFLTNGELKADEENFPELTYGVGEGKIFEVYPWIFEEVGGE